MLNRIIHKILKQLPFNSFKVFVYRSVYNYKIGENVIIGKSIIKCKSVIIGDNVLIRDNNIILCGKLEIGNNTAIHSGNVISGSANFIVGKNSRIINDHFFDLYNNITVGNNTWLAGKESQFWTHGSIHTKTGNKDLSISIGDNVYVGSKVCFAPGVKIENVNLIGLGSVVSRSILTNKNIVAGNPSKIVKENIDWRENW